MATQETLLHPDDLYIDRSQSGVVILRNENGDFSGTLRGEWTDDQVLVALSMANIFYRQGLTEGAEQGRQAGRKEVAADLAKKFEKLLLG